MKIADIKKLIDVDQFFKSVEQIKTDYDCSYVDAVIQCCKDQNIEPDLAATLIRSNPTMKKKLHLCSADLRLVSM